MNQKIRIAWRFLRNYWPIVLIIIAAIVGLLVILPLIDEPKKEANSQCWEGLFQIYNNCYSGSCIDFNENRVCIGNKNWESCRTKQDCEESLNCVELNKGTCSSGEIGAPCKKDPDCTDLNALCTTYNTCSKGDVNSSCNIEDDCFGLRCINNNCSNPSLEGGRCNDQSDCAQGDNLFCFSFKGTCKKAEGWCIIPANLHNNLIIVIIAILVCAIIILAGLGGVPLHKIGITVMGLFIVLIVLTVASFLLC